MLWCRIFRFLFCSLSFFPVFSFSCFSFSSLFPFPHEGSFVFGFHFPLPLPVIYPLLLLPSYPPSLSLRPLLSPPSLSLRPLFFLPLHLILSLTLSLSSSTFPSPSLFPSLPHYLILCLLFPYLSPPPSSPSPSLHLTLLPSPLPLSALLLSNPFTLPFSSSLFSISLLSPIAGGGGQGEERYRKGRKRKEGEREGGREAGKAGRLGRGRETGDRVSKKRGMRNRQEEGEGREEEKGVN